MNQSMEVFKFGDRVSGILVRRSTAEDLTTRLFFETPDGDNYSLTQTTWFEREDWTKFSYKENGEEISLQKSDFIKSATIGSEPTSALEHAIPSYAAHRVLTSLLRNGEKSVDFVQFQESPNPIPQRSQFVVEGSENIRIGNESLITKKVQLYSDRKRSNTFWVIDEVIVKSDWCGAESYLVDDLESALGTMNAALRSNVQKFLSTPG